MKGMTVKGTLGAAALLFGLAIGAPTAAHHSFAMFDQTKKVVLKGTVVAFQWTNPHAFLELDVPGAGGTSVHWSIELNSPNNLKRQGWSRNSVKPGDKVTVTINPVRNGKPGGLFNAVVLADGKTLSEKAFEGRGPVNVPTAD
jgi:hypothetical protein